MARALRLPAPASVPAPVTSRREELAHAAYMLIAEGGFERLRTRSVAARAGVNIATLHYYFPTKEALVRGAARHLAQQFTTLRAPRREADDARAQLRREFADTEFYLAKHPEMIAVMRELNARAQRDPSIAAIVDPMKQAWRRTVEAVLAAGISQGCFRPRMPPGEAAGVVVALLWGAATLPLSRGALARAQEAVERWLTAGRPARRKAA